MNTSIIFNQHKTSSMVKNTKNTAVHKKNTTAKYKYSTMEIENTNEKFIILFKTINSITNDKYEIENIMKQILNCLENKENKYKITVEQGKKKQPTLWSKELIIFQVTNTNDGNDNIPSIKKKTDNGNEDLIKSDCDDNTTTLDITNNTDNTNNTDIDDNISNVIIDITPPSSSSSNDNIKRMTTNNNLEKEKNKKLKVSNDSGYSS